MRRDCSPIPQPMFSVITICLNAGKKLMDTVATVLDQDCQSYECIIKDGCSTDASVELLPQNARLRIEKREDKGIYDAMNQALMLARGKYVIFLNAGDVFSSNDVLSKIAIAAQDAGFPALVYTDYSIRENWSQRYGQARELSKFTLFRNSLCHQTCYFNRLCYEACGVFDTSFKILGDHEFLVRTTKLKGFRAVHVSVVGVIFEGGGVSANPKNRETKKSEVQRLRKAHFPLIHRFCFHTFLAFSFPRLRGWLYDSPKSPRIVKQAYVALRNTLFGA